MASLLRAECLVNDVSRCFFDSTFTEDSLNVKQPSQGVTSTPGPPPKETPYPLAVPCTPFPQLGVAAAVASVDVPVCTVHVDGARVPHPPAAFAVPRSLCRCLVPFCG